MYVCMSVTCLLIFFPKAGMCIVMMMMKMVMIITIRISDWRW